MTYFIMDPVFTEAWTTGIRPMIDETMEVEPALERALQPFRAFMAARLDGDTFQAMAALRPGGEAMELSPDAPLSVLMPSFMLSEIARPLPVCADEAAHDRATLPALKGKYDVVNIKLDKTGGLTEALALNAEAEAQGFGIMVGCMVGTSLAMAPAVLVAQGAAVVDLDGPLLLAEDREPPLRYDAEGVHPPEVTLWG